MPMFAAFIPAIMSIAGTAAASTATGASIGAGLGLSTAATATAGGMLGAAAGQMAQSALKQQEEGPPQLPGGAPPPPAMGRYNFDQQPDAGLVVPTALTLPQLPGEAGMSEEEKLLMKILGTRGQ